MYSTFQSTGDAGHVEVSFCIYASIVHKLYTTNEISVTTAVNTYIAILPDLCCC